jgi:UDP-glucose 4-epimerase
MAILITGGAGYIGSHAARSLRRSGYEVLLYDNLSTGFPQLVEGFELIEGDVADEAPLRRALERVDAVMHFAAHAYVGESVENPRKYFTNNVLAAMTLLNSALDAGIRRFVFSSTCAVYGVPDRMPITEETPREPVDPYGASKLFFENALQAYSRGAIFAVVLYLTTAGWRRTMAKMLVFIESMFLPQPLDSLSSSLLALVVALDSLLVTQRLRH